MSVRVWSVVLILSVWMSLFSSGVVRDGVTDELDDDAVWGSVDCGSEELVELYLREFPKGRHAAEARACLARIEEKKDQKDRGAELESALDEAVQDDRTAGETFRDCDACPKMVVVPAGDFMMGSPSSEEGRDDDEGPRHRVTISKPFAVGKYEVTRGEFREFMSDTGRSSGRGCYVFSGGEWTQSDAHSWRSPGFAQGEEDPVVCVSWEDAKSYVKWLSGKTGLLSESEWEYVARWHWRSVSLWFDDFDGSGELPWQLHLWKRCSGSVSSKDGAGRKFSIERIWIARCSRQRMGVGGGLLA